MRASIHHSHREGRLTRTVAVHLPDGAEPRDRWLTRDEAAALLKAAIREPRVRLYLPLFIPLALYTGARKEAILSLRWLQVDLSAGRIDFNPSGARRTNKRRARIPIPSRLLPHLRRARRRGTDIGFVVHENGARLKDVKKGFASACQRARLKGVSPHTLRHTTATWRTQAGVEIWEASGYLGMSPETLQRVYAHHHPDHLHEPAEPPSGRPRMSALPGTFQGVSATIRRKKPNKITAFGVARSSPKAEVTGSNPVGRAIKFNSLVD